MADIRDFTRRRFLVADDETFMLGIIERMLLAFRPRGILKVTDGGAAIDKLNDDPTPVDCIIADFNMKPVNGLQLLKKIRTGESLGFRAIRSS